MAFEEGSLISVYVVAVSVAVGAEWSFEELIRRAEIINSDHLPVHMLANAVRFSFGRMGCVA